MTKRGDREAAAAAALRGARLDGFLALMPSGMPAEVQAEWRALSAKFADDPPTWAPSRRYAEVIRRHCVETCRLRHYDATLGTIDREVYRENDGAGGVKVRVNPYVALRAASLDRLCELDDMLELSPRGARKAKVSQFDAA